MHAQCCSDAPAMSRTLQGHPSNKAPEAWAETPRPGWGGGGGGFQTALAEAGTTVEEGSCLRGLLEWLPRESDWPLAWMDLPGSDLAELFSWPQCLQEHTPFTPPAVVHTQFLVRVTKSRGYSRHFFLPQT